MSCVSSWLIDYLDSPQIFPHYVGLVCWLKVAIYTTTYLWTEIAFNSIFKSFEFSISGNVWNVFKHKMLTQLSVEEDAQKSYKRKSKSTYLFLVYFYVEKMTSYVLTNTTYDVIFSTQN